MNIATQIASYFDNDGQIFEYNGISLEEACLSAGAIHLKNVDYLHISQTKKGGHFDEVFEFKDKSYISISGEGWDFSNRKGISWEDCILKKNEEEFLKLQDEREEWLDAVEEYRSN